MKKTPLLFVYDYENDITTDKVKLGNEWVFEGEGKASIKVDGSACLFKDGKLWKRFDRRLNKKFDKKFKNGEVFEHITIDMFRDAPDGFVPCEENPDPVTYHWPGWVPVSADKPEDVFHIEALKNSGKLIEGKTYELVGPKLSDNPYKLERHELWEHGALEVEIKRDFYSIKKFLKENEVEGLVFTHEDGRMAKVRRKDFNIFWVKEDLRKTHKAKKKLKF